MEPDRGHLEAFIAEELSHPVETDIGALADAIRQRFGQSARGVIYYGSCLRTGELYDKVLDFYVIVTDYAEAYEGWGMALANRILPPNVFYTEAEIGGRVLRTKYAVLSLADFARRCREETLNVTVWARFSQPAALVWTSDDDSRQVMAAAVTSAVQTMISAALPLVEPGTDAQSLWTTAFEATYAAELRAEKAGKGRELFDLDRDRYLALTPLVLTSLGIEHHGGSVDLRLDWSASPAERKRARRHWWLRRMNGKTVSLLRLIKGAFTFEGGIDYLAWKISRHSGVKIEVKPWQRRFPIVAGLVLFLSLRRRGAFR